jgi:cyclopropane fatty-acyl-phospholipid synthase-like methyltransferase
MAVNFNHIAYRAMEVCNALNLSTVEAAVARTHLTPGARVIDIGCGNGVVSGLLGRRFGLEVTAVERDPVMAALARERIAGAPGVTVVERLSGEVLETSPPFDLMVVIGATEAAGGGLRDPVAVFRRLVEHIVPSGWLLWGDLTWKGDPPEPVRQVVEATNIYLTDEGWRAAAAEAGLRLAHAEISDEGAWTRYREAMQSAVAAWLAAHPDHEDAPAVALRAQRTAVMLDLARPSLDFGLYLFRRD